jgi:exodeoxyribonuclease-5
MWELNPDSALKDADLLIIDECSMVGEELALDVLSFGCRSWCSATRRSCRRSAGAGYFTEAEPDVMLTEIHRQAADNPIVRIATRSGSARRWCSARTRARAPGRASRSSRARR